MQCVWLLWKNYVLFKRKVVLIINLYILAYVMLHIVITEFKKAVEKRERSFMCSDIIYSPKCPLTTWLVQTIHLDNTSTVGGFMDTHVVAEFFTNASQRNGSLTWIAFEEAVCRDGYFVRGTFGAILQSTPHVPDAIEKNIVQQLTGSGVAVTQITLRPGKVTENNPSKSLMFKVGLSIHVLLAVLMSQYLDFLHLERGQKMHDALLVMGVSRFMIRWTWELAFVITMVPVVIIIFISIHNFVKSSDPKLVILVLVLNTVHACVWLHLCVWIFPNSSLAASFLGLIIIPGQFLGVYFQHRFSLIFWASAYTCIYQLIGNAERDGQGLQWSSVNDQYQAEAFGFSTCSVATCVNYSAMGTALMYAISSVRMVDFLVVRDMCWEKFCRQRLKITVNVDDAPDVESMTSATSAGVSIEVDNVTKVYRSGLCGQRHQKAISNYSLSVYRNQITVLLGHNGSGKSTLIHLLVGLIYPDAGTARINGLDIRYNLAKVRRSIGLCTQENAYYEKLTVREHLLLCYGLRGVKRVDTQNRIEQILRKLQLEKRAGYFVRQLSGGMVRKLNFAMALAGPSSIIILDEPTVGMDPDSRRDVWGLLLQERNSRTILMCTHLLDEADILGDCIAIQALGQLRVCASPFYLKQKYGSGYKLVIYKRTGCNVENVTTFLQSYIMEIKRRSNSELKTSYLLPLDKTSKFGALLDGLDKHLERLNINNYGISLTKLDDVFMKIGRTDVLIEQRDYLADLPEKERSVNQYWSLLRQYEAMFMKMWLYMVHSPIVYLAIFGTSYTTAYMLKRIQILPPIIKGVGVWPYVILALIGMFYVQENTCRSRHMQYISGVPFIVMWSVAFLWDFTTVTITFALTFGILEYYGPVSTLLVTRDDHVIFCKMLWVHCCAGLSMVYVSTKLCTKPNLYVIGVLVVWIIHSVLYDMLVLIPDVRKVLRFFPLFSLQTCICNLLDAVQYDNQRLAFIQKYPDRQAPPELAGGRYGLVDDPNGGVYYSQRLWMCIGGAVWLLFIFLEYFVRVGMVPFSVEWPVKRRIPYHGDADVAENAILNYTASKADIKQHAVFLRGLSKRYFKTVVVNNMHLNIRKGECFGMLGVNGAGKTTVFKMMTGEIPIRSGGAWIFGHDLRRHLPRAQQLIGYCPQSDGLVNELTVTQTMYMYCLLRKYARKDIEKVMMAVAKGLNLTTHLRKRVSKLSGGDRRKLCIAVALVGDSPLILLDEPTMGIDAISKRIFWGTIAGLRDRGKSIVLTSHSMGECEALCTNVAIMVAGVFRCLGTTEHLKRKFSLGFTLTMQISRSVTDVRAAAKECSRFVATTFKGYRLLERHMCTMRFDITDLSYSWGNIFRLMEANMKNLNLDSYAITPTSLDEVFLQFVKR